MPDCYQLMGVIYGSQLGSTPEDSELIRKIEIENRENLIMLLPLV